MSDPSLRQQLTEIQAEILAMPHEKAVSAVFANLFVYASAIDALTAQLGRVEARVGVVSAKLDNVASLSMQDLSAEVKEVAGMVDDLRPLVGLVRDLRGDGYDG
jgi:hypothetical protein